MKKEILDYCGGYLVFMIFTSISYYFYPNLKTLTIIEKFLIYMSYCLSFETWKHVVKNK